MPIMPQFRGIETASNFVGRNRRQRPPPPSVPPGFGPARTTPKYPPEIINPVIVAARLRDALGIAEQPGYAAAPSNPMLGLPPGISNPILDRERKARIQQLCDQGFTQARDTPEILDAVPREDERYLVSHATALRSATISPAGSAFIVVPASQPFLVQNRPYRSYSLSSPGQNTSQLDASGKTSPGKDTQWWAPALCHPDLSGGSTPTTCSTVPETPHTKFNAAARAFFPPESAPAEVQAETFEDTASETEILKLAECSIPTIKAELPSDPIGPIDTSPYPSSEAKSIRPPQSFMPVNETELSTAVELLHPKGASSSAETHRPPHSPALANPEHFSTAEQALGWFLSQLQTPRPPQSCAHVHDAELSSAIEEQIEASSYPSSEAETVKPSESSTSAVENKICSAVEDPVNPKCPPSPRETLTPPQSPQFRCLEAFPNYSTTAERAAAYPYWILRPRQETLEIWSSTTSDEIITALQEPTITEEPSNPESVFESYRSRSYTSSPWSGTLHLTPFTPTRRPLPALAPGPVDLAGIGPGSNSQVYGTLANTAVAPSDLVPPSLVPGGAGLKGAATAVVDEDKVMETVEFETPNAADNQDAMTKSPESDASNAAPSLATRPFHPGVWTNFDGTPITIPLIRGTLTDHRVFAAQNQLRETGVPLMSTNQGPTPEERQEEVDMVDQSSLPIFIPPHPYGHLSWKQYEEKLHELIKINEDEIGALECLRWGYAGQQERLLQLRADEKRLRTVCQEYIDAKWAMPWDRIWRFQGLDREKEGEVEG